MSSFVLRFDPCVAGAFLHIFEDMLRMRRYDRILAYANPEGTDVAQFRRRDTIISVEVRENAEGYRTVTIESESPESAELVRRAAVATAIDVLGALLAPFVKLQPDDLRTLVQTWVEERLVRDSS